MKLEGCEEINKDINALWQFLSAPDEIMPCFPGVVSYSFEGNIIKAKVKQGIGFIKGTFDVSIKIIENDVVNKKAILNIEGTGSLGNFTSNVQIYVANEGSRKLCYAADYQIGGMLGTVSSAVINNTVKKIIKDFLDCAINKLST